jgi:hypothetical protein
VGKDIVFNHDGFSLLAFLEATERTEQDAANLLVLPLHNVGITAIDWCIMSTAHHNCRTRYDFAFDGKGQGRRIDKMVGNVISHYNRQKLDLLDVVVKHGHANGMQVFGSVRLNHASLERDKLLEVPGRSFDDTAIKKDFRDEQFHIFLCNLFEDILLKGADGIILDFERKTPFFPPDATPKERFDATRSFVSRVRALTEKSVGVRCAHRADKGDPEGQDPVAWMTDGLIDIAIPATHNHDPDNFKWGIGRFVQAARNSPRQGKVWPQIWPTGAGWAAEGSSNNQRHSPEAVRQRSRDLVDQGADGVYFFNFCCDGWPAPPGFGNSPKDYEQVSDIFMNIPQDKVRSEAIFSGLPKLLEARR